MKMKSVLIVLILALSAVSSSAFVKGSPRVARKETCVFAEKKAAKKASKSKAAKEAAPVTAAKAEPKAKKPLAPVVRKADFVAIMAEKTGLSKESSAMALTAALETIKEVCSLI
jgi:hypothetical protein